MAMGGESRGQNEVVLKGETPALYAWLWPVTSALCSRLAAAHSVGHAECLEARLVLSQSHVAVRQAIAMAIWALRAAADQGKPKPRKLGRGSVRELTFFQRIPGERRCARGSGEL